MFDMIARWYDGTNRLMSLGLDGLWRRRAVALLDPRPGGIYLDVGVGTGDVAYFVAERARDGRVVGIDPSFGMLEVARAKMTREGVAERVHVMAGDVLDLSFPDDTFDGAITSFCIRNVTDRRRGLREIRRVVKPGGRFVILELTEPVGPIMRPLFRAYARVLMPVISGIMSSAKSYRYLADSMADFPKPWVFLRAMEENGFVTCRYEHLTGGIVTVFVGEVP
jgi:demethylmenaquinone methyltransferase / 2-methoxy-6-polyprenyl-1,4-benzoquinol methylase